MVVVEHAWIWDAGKASAHSQPPPLASGGLAYILVCYERPIGTLRALAGVLAQQPPADTLIIVDNSRSDRVEQSLQRHFHRHPPTISIRYVRLANNPGPAGATWFGYKSARDTGYEYAAVIDDNEQINAGATTATLVSILDAHKQTAIGIGHTGAHWTRWGTLRSLATPSADEDVVLADVIGGAFLILRVRDLPDAALPNPRLFFGYFDTEHSLRLSRRYGHLLVAAQPLRNHRLQRGAARAAEAPQSRFAARRKTVLLELRDHRRWQTYYRNRNYVWFVSREYGRWDQAGLYAARFLGKSLVAMAMSPRQGFELGRLGIVGILDGALGNFDRSVGPSQRDISPDAVRG